MDLLPSNYCAICGLVIQQGTIIDGKQYHYNCVNQINGKDKEIHNAEISHGSHGVQGIMVTDRGFNHDTNKQFDSNIQIDEEKKYQRKETIDSIRTTSISIVPAVNQRPHLHSDISDYQPLNDICEIRFCYNDAEMAITCKKCSKKICGHCVNWEQHDIDKTGYFCKQCPPNLCEIAGCEQREFGFVCTKCSKKLCATHWNETDETINQCTECTAKKYVYSLVICIVVTVANCVFNWYWLYLTILKLSNVTAEFINTALIVVNGLFFTLPCIQKETLTSNIVTTVMIATSLAFVMACDAVMTIVMLNSYLSNYLLFIAFYLNCIYGVIYRIVLYFMYSKYFNVRQYIFWVIMYCVGYLGIGVYICLNNDVKKDFYIFGISLWITGLINIVFDTLAFFVKNK